MANPPLFEAPDDTTEEDVTAPAKNRLSTLKQSGQALSQQIASGMQQPAKRQGGAVPQTPEMQELPPLTMPQQQQQQKKQPTVKRAQPATVGDETDSSAAVTTGPATAPITGGVADISSLPKLRGLAYGPNSEGATKADQSQTHGALGELQPGDLAISPNQLSRYPLGSHVNVVDSKGNIVLSNQRIADTSWIGPGKPTTDTFEVWNGKSYGSGYYLQPISAPTGASASGSVSAPVSTGDFSTTFAAPTASFAEGGIVTQPTVAMVGEAGPEAIIPLNPRGMGGGGFAGIGGLMGEGAPTPAGASTPGARAMGQKQGGQQKGRSPLSQLSNDFGAIQEWLSTTLS